MNPEATLTSKNQMTLPKAVREKLRARQGDRLEFEPSGPDTFTVRRVRETTLDEIAGILKLPKDHPGVSVEEMRTAGAEAAVERFERSQRGGNESPRHGDEERK